MHTRQVYERLEEIGAHGAEARAAAILAGLSFEPDMQLRATKTFSGGWRMRIAVCSAPFPPCRSCRFQLAFCMSSGMPEKKRFLAYCLPHRF